MTVIARLLLFFIVVLGGQSWAFGLTHASIYGYDVFPKISEKQYAPSRFQNSGYDELPGCPDILEKQSSDTSNKKYGVGSFFAFADGFVTKGADTLKPGSFAKESIPAHRGRPTVAEQKQVNELMEKHGCHTCGTKDPGAKSGNAVADHQPPQALGEPKEFLPHCIDCARRQGGQVLQEKLRNQ